MIYQNVILFYRFLVLHFLSLFYYKGVENWFLQDVTTVYSAYMVLMEVVYLIKCIYYDIES